MCIRDKMLTMFLQCFLLKYIFQNLNKQAYDLAKALLKRTAQAIEPYITNVSENLNLDETKMYNLMITEY